MSLDRTAFHRMIWRWHFYAGLFVIPFVLILSLTGAAYLFKPQVEAWEERAWSGMDTAGGTSPDVQRDAALAAFPGARFDSYRLPRAEGDAALVHLALPGGSGAMRDVFVSPQGRVVGALNPDRRIMAVIHDIHGELLLGKRGGWLVELAASWAIVMVLTGLYLWWPAKGTGGGKGLAGVIWPRLGGGRKVFWRDLHAVTGFWVAGLALVLLTTGLPWAGVWGSVFKAVRAEAGLTKGQQDWTIGGAAGARSAAAAEDEHAEHNHAAMAQRTGGGMHHHGAMAPVRLSEIVARAKGEHLAFPVIVTPPDNAWAGTAWTVKSEAQNRPLRMSITFDPVTGAETARDGFADKHAIDRIVAYGIAWHEGQLLGWVNQLIGVMTASMLIVLVVSGFVMWRRRRPDGTLGAPPLPPVPAKMRGVAAIVLLLATLLPLLAASLIALLLAERLILVRMPAVARWLGIESAD